MFDAGVKIFLDEVGAAPVFGGPGGLQRQRAGERTFVKRDAGDDANVVRATSGEKFVLRILVEDVVDDLNGVNEAGLYGANAVPWFPAVHAYPDGLDLAAGAKRLDGADGAVVLEPFIFPGVVLDQIQGIHADVAQTLVHIFEDVFRRVGNVERKFALRGPAAIFGRNFAGDVKFFGGIGSQGFAEELFAVAVAIGPGGVKEIAAQIKRARERRERSSVVEPGPPRHAPHAVADFADLPAGSSESAITQRAPP